MSSAPSSFTTSLDNLDILASQESPAVKQAYHIRVLTLEKEVQSQNQEHQLAMAKIEQEKQREQREKDREHELAMAKIEQEKQREQREKDRERWEHEERMALRQEKVYEQQQELMRLRLEEMRLAKDLHNSGIVLPPLPTTSTASQWMPTPPSWNAPSSTAGQWMTAPPSSDWQGPAPNDRESGLEY